MALQFALQHSTLAHCHGPRPLSRRLPWTCNVSRAKAFAAQQSHRHRCASATASRPLRSAVSYGSGLLSAARNGARVGCSAVRQKRLHVVASPQPVRPDPTIPETEKERSPLDYPQEWITPEPSRRPDIFPEFEKLKTPMPKPMPGDPEKPDEFEPEPNEEEEEYDEEEQEGDESIPQEG